MKNKGIAGIAVACIMILLITTLAACGKKVPMIKLPNGLEYPLVTDAEGNTVLNEYGQIAIYVTDAKGEYLTDTNGERQTNAVTFPNQLGDVGKNTLETPQYKVVMPEGWALDDQHVFVYNKDQKVTMEFLEAVPLTDNNPIDKYVSTQIEALKYYVETQPDVEFEATGYYMLGDTDHPYRAVYIRQVDESGKVLAMEYQYFIDIGKMLVKVDFICQDTALWDDTDPLTIITDCFTVKNFSIN